jgi:hypothetical protein
MAHYFEVGEYTGRVIAQGFTESKEKHTPGFFLEVEMIAAKGPNVLPSNARPKLIRWWITEGTIEFTIEKLRRLGWQGSKLAELDPSAENHHSFVDQEIEVYCTHDGDYDNFDLSQKFETETVSGLASKLDKLFGKQVMATASKTRKKAEKPTTPDASPELRKAVDEADVTMPDGEDEIPF